MNGGRRRRKDTVGKAKSQTEAGCRGATQPSLRLSMTLPRGGQNRTRSAIPSNFVSGFPPPGPPLSVLRVPTGLVHILFSCGSVLLKSNAPSSGSQSTPHNTEAVVHMKHSDASRISGQPRGHRQGTGCHLCAFFRVANNADIDTPKTSRTRCVQIFAATLTSQLMSLGLNSPCSFLQPIVHMTAHHD